MGHGKMNTAINSCAYVVLLWKKEGGHSWLNDDLHKNEFSLK
jgi:hypothetical protein